MARDLLGCRGIRRGGFRSEAAVSIDYASVGDHDARGELGLALDVLSKAVPWLAIFLGAGGFAAEHPANLLAPFCNARVDVIARVVRPELDHLVRVAAILNVEVEVLGRNAKDIELVLGAVVPDEVLSARFSGVLLDVNWCCEAWLLCFGFGFLHNL